MDVAFLERLLEILDEDALAVLVVHIHEHCRTDDYLHVITRGTSPLVRPSPCARTVPYMIRTPVRRRRDDHSPLAAACVRCAQMHGAGCEARTSHVTKWPPSSDAFASLSHRSRSTC